MVKLRHAWRSGSSVLAATAAALCLWGLWSDASGVATPASGQTVQPGTATNGPDEQTRAWIQATLHNWETICRRYLHIDLEPLPWMIFYDEKQAWHLAADEKLLPPQRAALATSFLFNGRPRTLLRVAHDNTDLWVPSGKKLPIGPGKAPHTFAMPYDNGTKSFFVLALPSVIRALAGADNQNLDKLFLGLAGHELAHTRQLVDVMRRIKTLREKHDVPIGIDDNFIQKTYSADEEYARLFAEERATFFRAVMEDSDQDTSRRLVLEALSIAERRRARFFTGARAVHAELDDIFLVMEGVGEWVRFQLKRQQVSPSSRWHQTVNEMMADSDAWSQHQGLALFLLIDRLVPDWQSRFLSPNFPSPFAVLREALTTPRATNKRGRAHDASSASSRLSHSRMRFQLANVRAHQLLPY